ncbi:MAG: DUF1570 domain-containing protein [Planctomycetota bacterium]
MRSVLHPRFVVCVGVLVFSVRAGAQELQFKHQSETKHFIVKSNISRTLCIKAGTTLERFSVVMRKFFKMTPDPKRPKTPVIIFETQKELMDYMAKHGFPVPKVAQQCTGRLLQFGGRPWEVVACDTGQGESQIMTILLHETTHLFAGLTIDAKFNLRVWASEGLATYFEPSQWRGARLVTGVVDGSRLLVVQAALRDDKFIPLADLLARERANFDQLCYCEAWSFVHFLMGYKNGIYRKRLGSYLEMIRDQKTHDEAFKAAFGDNIGKLERAWKLYIKSLNVPSGRR